MKRDLRLTLSDWFPVLSRYLGSLGVIYGLVTPPLYHTEVNTGLIGAFIGLMLGPEAVAAVTRRPPPPDATSPPSLPPTPPALPPPATVTPPVSPERTQA